MVYGEYHRENGPAFMDDIGHEQWYNNGLRINPNLFKEGYWKRYGKRWTRPYLDSDFIEEVIRLIPLENRNTYNLLRLYGTKSVPLNRRINESLS